MGIISLCETFRRQAFWTWDKLSLARKHDTTIGEESLTDFNLLEIRSRHPSQVITKTFTKRMEAVEGADWEWWLTGSSNLWIGFRLQAKVIHFGTNTYRHLHYVPTGRPPQSSTLCDRAIASRCIPLYCFYSQWGHGLHIPWGCMSFPPAPESYGCSLIDGFFIRSLGETANRYTLNDLLPFKRPWHCLVCCGGYAVGEDLPHRTFAYWQRNLKQEDSVSSFDFSPQLQKEPPSYVRSLQNGDLPEAPDPYLRSIILIDSTSEE